MSKRFVKRESQYERKYAPQLKRAMNAQIKPYIDWLSAQQSLQPNEGKIEQLIDPEIVSNMLSSMTMYIAQREAALIELELKAMIKKKAANPKRAQYAKTTRRYIREQAKPLYDEITDYTKRRIRELTRDAMARNLSAKQAAAFVDKEMRNSWNFRIKRIVRTEVSRAMNFGRLMGMLQTGYDVRKQWSATMDHKTRHTHVLLNGKRKELVDPFVTVNGEIWMPHDPNAPLSETVNCRCSLIYVPKMRNGEPVMMTTAKIKKIYNSGDKSARLIINEMISAGIL